MLIDLLRKRRSVRRFTGQPLDKDTLGKITETLLRSPSSRDIQPWRFHITTDAGMIQKLSVSKKHGSGFLSGAALAVVITGDETKSDVWIEDCSIAAILVQLLATDLGLGSCWAQIRNRPHDDTKSAAEYVQQLLSLPSHERVGMIIGIGYPDEHPEPVPGKKLKREKVLFIQPDEMQQTNFQ